VSSFTPEERQRLEQQIRALHADSVTRNDIARRLGIGTRTVSVYATRMGLTFDNAEMTETATQNRKAQLAARRMDLAEALQEDAERLTEQMWEPAVVFNFGGKDNTFEKRPVDEPPADAKRALMGAAGMAIDRSLKLVPAETDQQGLAAVDQWLRGMMGGSDDAG
jgi:hypothetical protein